jgi:metal-responsive CopG/Arc/MetJ family transcriptional regulator
MAKQKVAVAMSGWLLDELDSAASKDSVSRSSLVEEAVSDYLARRYARAEDRTFRSGASLALEDMERLAAECEQDAAAVLEPSSLEKLRVLRASGRGLGA